MELNDCKLGQRVRWVGDYFTIEGINYTRHILTIRREHSDDETQVVAASAVELKTKS